MIEVVAYLHLMRVARDGLAMTCLVDSDSGHPKREILSCEEFQLLAILAKMKFH